VGVRLYVWLVSRTAARADLVLTDSLASRRDIVTHLGLPEERVRPIWLAADNVFVPDSQPDDRAIRARYGLPEEYVLYLGGFDPRKNVRALLQAWRRAQPTLDPGAKLVVAGRLPQNSTFDLDPRQIARDLDIDPQSLVFPGFVAEAHKPAVYRGGLCFVFPSDYEGFGLPPLEALSCGLPVIGSHLSSLPEVIGEGGLLFEPDDVSGMAEAIVSLVTNPVRRARLKERALAQAARFSWSETARQTLACYQEVKP
jgi:glycosyltransferase involved in cell wall biosynthesis